MGQGNNSINDRSEMPRCFVTRITSPQRGAVSVLSMAGPDAARLVRHHFQSATGKPLDQLRLNRIVFGRWRLLGGSCEEVVVCWRSEDEIEVSCHGGAAASQAIMATLTAVGAVERSAAEWAQGRFAGTIEVDALLALTDARTERVAAILLDQHRGALREAVQTVIEILQRGETCAAKVKLRQLCNRAQFGKHLIDPWRVVFAGPPNAGKSSLINRLLGYQRAIVFDKPGTTRDLLSALAVFDGWPVELIDSAGLRTSSNAIEREGVQRTEAMLDRADLTVLVFDATTAWDADCRELTRGTCDPICVLNKQDLPPGFICPHGFVATSAKTGHGLDPLMHRIVKRLIDVPYEPGDAVPFTTQQIDAIARANNAVLRDRRDDALAILTSLLTHNDKRCAARLA